jgi:hypothetical protein
MHCELETTNTASCLRSSKQLSKQSTAYGLYRCCVLPEEDASVRNWCGRPPCYTLHWSSTITATSDMCARTSLPPETTSISWPLIRLPVPADPVKWYEVLEAQDGVLFATLVLHNVGSNPDAYRCIHIGWVKHSCIYKVVQIWPGLFVCKQVTACPGHIWNTLYI